jgi:hypothetical protein
MSTLEKPDHIGVTNAHTSLVRIHRLRNDHLQPEPRDIIKLKPTAQAYVYDSLAQRAEAWHWRRPVRRFDSAIAEIFSFISGDLAVTGGRIDLLGEATHKGRE